MKIKAIGPIRYDGTDIEPGAEVNLPQKVAKPLIDAGAAEEVSGARAPAAASPLSKQAEEKEDPAGDQLRTPAVASEGESQDDGVDNIELFDAPSDNGAGQ